MIHLSSIQMPPGAGGGGETAEGARGPLFPAGTWRGSSGPPRRPGSPEDSEMLHTCMWSCLGPQAASSPGLIHHLPSRAHVEVASWGVINLVSHEGNIC